MTTKFKHLTIKIGLLVVVVMAIATCGVILLKHTATDAAQKPSAKASTFTPSQFSFNGVSGWWQGATNKTSMALFSNDHTCFTSVQYQTGVIDAATELQKLQLSQAGTGGSATPGAVLPLTLQTSTGQKQYDLHQYSLTSGDSSEQLMRGLELGYLQLSGGYIKVEGHCNTPDQLSTTLPALQSIKFDENK